MANIIVAFYVYNFQVDTGGGGVSSERGAQISNYFLIITKIIIFLKQENGHLHFDVLSVTSHA